MDHATLIDWVPSLALGIALAACAGLRAWLPLLLTGLLGRAGLFDLGTSFQFLSSNRALILFGTATVVEILADKIPSLDHALDALSTVIRPAAGSLLAATAIGHLTDPLSALAVGVAVGAPSALIPHAAKAAVRATSTAVTGGLGNPLISAAEDAGTVVLFALAILVPVAVVAGLAVASVLLVRRLARRAHPAAA
jgi:hypothetical protein